MHIRIGIDVPVFIDCMPGLPNLGQTVRAESCERKYTILTQDTGNFGQAGGKVVEPWQQHVCKDKINAAVFQRNF